MRIAAFIRANKKQIIGEWETYAQTLVPASNDMTPLALRNHIRPLLEFIADDIESAQTDSEQIKKSHGKKVRVSKQSAAEAHASLRLAGGFDMNQMVSEYRALRASIIRLWGEQLTEMGSNDVSDLTRFNESIDQELTESINQYSKKLDHSRHLFLGILGHDLRNPLGAMRMSANLALQIGPMSERQTMLVSQVAESADRATEIVDHLLDLTRARLGSGFPVVTEEMDMAFVARQLVDEARAAHPARTITLNISGDTKGEWDKARIGQVFSNLLGNAMQYGFRDLPIGVTIVGQPDELTLSIHNYGVPIPPDKLGRIFESLTRGKGEEDEEGEGSVNLGLGLYITKEIVTAHRGTIRVTSSENGGTNFVACFPRHPLSISA